MSCQCEALITALAKELGYKVTKKCVNEQRRLMAARNNAAVAPMGMAPWPLPEPVYEYSVEKEEVESDLRF